MKNKDLKVFAFQKTHIMMILNELLKFEKWKAIHCLCHTRLSIIFHHPFLAHQTKCAFGVWIIPKTVEICRFLLLQAEDDSLNLIPCRITGCVDNWFYRFLPAPLFIWSIDLFWLLHWLFHSLFVAHQSKSKLTHFQQHEGCTLLNSPLNGVIQTLVLKSSRLCCFRSRKMLLFLFYFWYRLTLKGQ